jgi:hypothetical protein
MFAVRNNFYLGAFNTVLNEASDIDGLTDLEQIERDAFIYRSYIALGSYQVTYFNLVLGKIIVQKNHEMFSCLL